jgi:cytochrome c
MKFRTVYMIIISLMLAVLAPRAIASSAGADIAAGRKLAEQACGRCHAIGRDDESTLAAAPPLRSFAAKWPPDNLEEALAEGIVTGHPDMPEFKFAPKQITDLLSYIQSISP